MAYTILKSDGTLLTTIPDGTINTTSTSIGLPGRNYAGYGQTLDTNFVHQLENFADSTPPANPLRGQLWYNTNNSTLYVCPTDGETNSANWLALSVTSSGGTTTFGSVNVTGNISANNVTATNDVSGNVSIFNYATVTTLATIGNANITTGNVTTLRTAVITTGANSTAGALTGTWTLNGGNTGNTAIITNGNIYISNNAGANLYGIKTDKYMYANGDPINFGTVYSNANVASYLPVYNGNILLNKATVTQITSGGVSANGNITGNWTLTSGSKLNATYADMAERFAADKIYDPGTVVELGGEKEITAVRYELSEDVFGVISNSAGYILNAGAGNDNTHPPVAVSGRVRVKVKGVVKKGDRLVSAGEGMARAATHDEINAFNTIGRALEDKTTTDIGIVEAIVVIK